MSWPFYGCARPLFRFSSRRNSFHAGYRVTGKLPQEHSALLLDTKLLDQAKYEHLFFELISGTENCSVQFWPCVLSCVQRWHFGSRPLMHLRWCFWWYQHSHYCTTSWKSKRNIDLYPRFISELWRKNPLFIQLKFAGILQESDIGYFFLSPQRTFDAYLSAWRAKRISSGAGNNVLGARQVFLWYATGPIFPIFACNVAHFNIHIVVHCMCSVRLLCG